ncbi:MAG: hypothetical protein KKF48_00615 [Nanoarchaeota archaeon]|nr:hypothetical protein [Nanoarchaeota archaeon]MBU1027525.1 hypothetical protein [Nanoarchaeota archaeon]
MQKDEKFYVVVIAIAFVALLVGVWFEFFSSSNVLGMTNANNIQFSPEDTQISPFIIKVLLFALITVILAIVLIWILKRVGLGRRPRKKIVKKKISVRAKKK